MTAYGKAFVLAVVLTADVLGCGDSGAPLGSGNHLKTDVDATSPTDVPDATWDSSPFAPLDGRYGRIPDGYAPLAICAQCACGAGTFCYGGSAYASFSGACDQTTSTTMDVGCHAIPAGCAAEPDCVCILQSILPQSSCYQVCADDAKGGFTVYCPP